MVMWHENRNEAKHIKGDKNYGVKNRSNTTVRDHSTAPSGDARSGDGGSKDEMSEGDRAAVRVCCEKILQHG